MPDKDYGYGYQQQKRRERKEDRTEDDDLHNRLEEGFDLMDGDGDDKDDPPNSHLSSDLDDEKELTVTAAALIAAAYFTIPFQTTPRMSRAGTNNTICGASNTGPTITPDHTYFRTAGYFKRFRFHAGRNYNTCGHSYTKGPITYATPP